MSHVADVKCRIYDLDALADACEVLGCQLVVDQKTYRWYGRFLNDWSDASRAAALKGHDPKTFGKCQHVIRVPGASYDIGVVPALDGDGFDLIYDAYCGGHGIEKHLGAGLPALVDEYATQVTMRSLAREGFTVERGVDADGNTQVYAFAR